MHTADRNNSIPRHRAHRVREFSRAAACALSLVTVSLAWAQVENSPSGSVFIEGVLCISDTSSCGVGESVLHNEELKIKDGIPMIYFQNTTASINDSKEWFLRTDLDRFGIYDHGDNGDRTAEVLGIQSGAPVNSLRILSNGNTGLGTAAPLLPLHIVRNGFPGIRIENEVQAWHVEADHISFALYDATHNKRPLVVTPDAPEFSISIRPTGNVGLGTNAPVQELEIFEPEFPAIRLSSNSRTWDIEGDHVSFSLFDITGGARPVEIAVGAPTAALYINAAGNIGSGTVGPTEAVDIARYANAARFQLTSFTNEATQAPQFIQRRARGTSPGNAAALQDNDNLGLFSFRGHNGTTMGGSRATITAQAAGTFSASSTPTRLIFATTPVGSTAPQSVLVITPDGKVQVKGVNLNVPDFVFADDYELMPLEELKTFIDKNGHLPGIASAQQVKDEGLDLAGSQMSQLQKIEELTLYTLRQEQRLTEQDAELGMLRQRLANLEALGAQTAALQEELLALRAGLEELHRPGALESTIEPPPSP